MFRTRKRVEQTLYMHNDMYLNLLANRVYCTIQSIQVFIARAHTYQYSTPQTASANSQYHYSPTLPPFLPHSLPSLPPAHPPALPPSSPPSLSPHRECFMARMAAMKKVLSPISDTMMTEMEAANAWKNPTLIHWTRPSVWTV